MAVQFDHTIVPVHDKYASANFLADVLGLAPPVPASQFLCVAVDHGVNLDFCEVDGDIRPEHYAFRVGEAEFDAIFSRIRERALHFWADPRRSRPGEIAVRGRGRGFYFADPSGHFLEVLTRPDEQLAVA